jgi:hypothetical protein
MPCKTWSQPDADHWRGLCVNRMFPETGTEGCPVCIRPEKVPVNCGGACFDGSPPASINVSIAGEFIAEDGTDLSGFTGVFGLTRTGIRAQCCVYVGRSPNMKPYTFYNLAGQLLTIPVENQIPDLEAEICSGGGGFFRMRIAGDPTASFFQGTPGQPAGFTWFHSEPEGDSGHRCKSPWLLPRVALTPSVPAGPFDSSVLWVGHVTPPPSVTLWW